MRKHFKIDTPRVTDRPSDPGRVVATNLAVKSIDSIDRDTIGQNTINIDYYLRHRRRCVQNAPRRTSVSLNALIAKRADREVEQTGV